MLVSLLIAFGGALLMVAIAVAMCVSGSGK